MFNAYQLSISFCPDHSTQRVANQNIAGTLQNVHAHHLFTGHALVQKFAPHYAVEQAAGKCRRRAGRAANVQKDGGNRAFANLAAFVEKDDFVHFRRRIFLARGDMDLSPCRLL